VDTIVLIDDSIVRGTTLKQSVITMLSRFKPKKIVIVSSCPQIRYPDCYGIDMSKIGDFITFQACIELLKETGRESLIQEVYEKSKSELEKPKILIRNIVKELYDNFTDDEISKKISQMVKGGSECEVEVVYQSLEGLHKSLPKHYGDWYFSGDYPTNGGMMVVNKSFINYFEGKNLRSY
ncbi:amidophosphoribosyltransferase, partial [bacterium]|nr:amidophosphoribosyltransferase [bacterium]